jgi:hypothetical protein
MPETRSAYDEMQARQLACDHKYASYATRPWHTREMEAQKQRAPVVWRDEPFWRERSGIWQYHFVHVSTRDPAMLAYTASDDKGERDIQTPIKPGRYLAQFFSGVLTERQIKYYAAWHAEGAAPSTAWDSYELKFAHTPDEIVYVYEHGVRSCVVFGHESPTHPCRAFGAGDLAVAYLEGTPLKPNHPIVARTLVRPEKLVASTLYPVTMYAKDDGFRDSRESRAAQQTLQKKLRALGYRFHEEKPTTADFRGARLLKIPSPWCPTLPIIPSLDSGNYAVDKGEFLILT